MPNAQEGKLPIFPFFPFYNPYFSPFSNMEEYINWLAQMRRAYTVQ
jgi:hypothetical protein